jgi:hypothetical protein
MSNHAQNFIPSPNVLSPIMLFHQLPLIGDFRHNLFKNPSASSNRGNNFSSA